ncbi:MAG TPA: S41 family peptidase [Chitinophagaceae bacterium]|nr:S41 family peptidase [Chitinophagaceae bacterium]
MQNDMLMKGLRRKERYHKEPKQVSKYSFSFCFIIVIAFLFGSCSAIKYSSYNPQNKIAPEKLKKDFILLKKILEANHPSLYWYTPKDSINSYFNQTLQSINDSLTEIQFRNKVAWFIAKIRCGHTTVRPSKAFVKYVSKHEFNRFPLLLKVWNDSLIVLGSLNRNDSALKRGSLVTSIDGHTSHELLDSIFQFISTDGYAANFKNQAISFNFPVYYSFAYPLKDSFFIRYTDSTGVQKETYVKLFKPSSDTAKFKLPGIKTRPPTHKEKKLISLLNKRSITYDTVNRIAYMRIATFSDGKLNSFFKQSFRELKNKNLHNLIIDLRENTGGSITTSINLARYIKDKPFRLADTVAAINRSLTYGRYINLSLFYRVVMRFTTHKKTDGKFHFVALEKYAYKPLRNLHYNGNVYIVQGGYTFSAAAMFVLNVKGQQNVTVVGEETGGGDYGTSAVHLPSIILPNSKVQVVLPLYRIVDDSTKIKDGHGIQPDVFIPPSSTAIKQGIDIKLQTIKKLIQQHAVKGE